MNKIPLNPESFSKSQISKFMAHMGRKGGLKGGIARKEALSPERRRQIASEAAKKRWANKPHS